MANDIDMDSTMREIELQDNPNTGNIRDDLVKEISKLETDIGSAELQIQKQELEPMGHTPISPEQANEIQKNVVFLKKDLSKKRSDLRQLDE
jgi:hypothetical protein